MVEFVGLDDNSVENAPLFADLQGNILKGHGRNYAALIVIAFAGDSNSLVAVRRWLGNLHVTSTAQQLLDASLYRSGRDPQSCFVTFHISAAGFQTLGCKNSTIPGDVAFREGMKIASSLRLADPAASRWETAYKQEVHGLLLIAHDSKEELDRSVAGAVEEITATRSAVLCVERGSVIRNQDGAAVEHFGFADGVSQPLFLKRDIERVMPEVFNAWDPTANPYHLVLVEDPIAPGTYGSYLVFRKLQQDVPMFRRQCMKLARSLGHSTDSRSAAALALGRFPAGTSIATYPHEVSERNSDNRFNFDADPTGLKCPLHAHVRKMNPRDSDLMTRSRRIARRGITYGTPTLENSDRRSEASPDRGLLFISFQQDLSRQFEFLQRMWANRDTSPNGSFSGMDPIMGQIDRRSQPFRPQGWPVRWGDSSAGKRDIPFHAAVIMRGGEYFYTPSLRALKLISGF